MMKNAPADSQDHRSMPPHQRLEGGAFAVNKEMIEKLLIPQVPAALKEDDATKLFHDFRGR
jgi:hypothetical protein